MAGCLQTWFFIASFIPWLLIDRIGRRPLVRHSQIPKKLRAESQNPVSLNDLTNGRRHGSSSRPCPPSSVQHTFEARSWQRSSSHAVYLPGCIHDRFPGHGLGVSVRSFELSEFRGNLGGGGEADVLHVELRYYLFACASAVHPSALHRIGSATMLLFSSRHPPYSISDTKLTLSLRF